MAFTFINCSNKGIPEIIDKQTNQKSADDAVISSDSLIMDPSGSLQAPGVGSNRRPPTATPGNSGNLISNRDTFENYVRKGLVFFLLKNHIQSP